MNKVVLVGRTTKDVALNYVGDQQQPKAKFTLAVTRHFRNVHGELETDFIQCVVWGKTAENMQKYCGKGSLISVSGRLQVDSYTNAEKKRVYVTEVVADTVEFLGTKKPADPLEHFKQPNETEALPF